MSITVCQRIPDRRAGLRHWEHASPHWTVCCFVLHCFNSALGWAM